MSSASSAALQCQSEALFATAAEISLQEWSLPSMEPAERSTGSFCLLLPGSSPIPQGYANARADCTSMREDAHVVFLLSFLFINIHMDKSLNLQWELEEFRGGCQDFSPSRYFIFPLLPMWIAECSAVYPSCQGAADTLVWYPGRGDDNGPTTP